MIRHTLCLFSLALAALAQIPGQYPPGQLPGQYPPGSRTPGQTNPNGRQPQPDNRTPRGNAKGKNVPPVVTTTGILRRVSPNQVVIEATDHRIIWYRFASQMPVRKEGKDADLNSFTRGDTVSVDSNEDDDGILTAVAVSWQKAATPEDRAAAARQWDLPKLPAAGRASTSASSPVREPGDERPVIRRKDPEPASAAQPEVATAPPPAAQPAEQPVDDRPTTVMRPPDPKLDDDDSGPPALRRGAPPKRAPATPDPVLVVQAPPTTSSSTTPAPTSPASTSARPAPAAPKPPPVQAAAPPELPQEDSVITKAREAAAAYTDTLPNFFVQQFATRYQSDTPKQDWHALDIVSADVAYENGTESYKNVKVGNKASKSMDDVGGAHSTGEFSTMLESLLEDQAATFRRKGQDTIRNRSAWVYTYEIPRELARFRVESPSQLYYPALRGSIWIDRETSRVLRIEQQARDLPRLFPFDTVETTADYDFVRLGTTGPFLLPVEAEVLSCIRGTSVCSRNKIEFRNYRKFGADTNITFGDN